MIIIRNDGYSMKGSPASQFLQNLENQFHKELQSLQRMRDLLQRQSNLLRNDDLFHYHNTARERRELLTAINFYNGDLVELKGVWPRFKKKFPSEIQHHVQRKFREVIYIAKQIIELENGAHKLISNFAPILPGGLNE